MTTRMIRLGEVATFAGQEYRLHGVAESLTDLLRVALTLRELDTLQLVIAPLPSQGYGIWYAGLANGDELL